jgi:Ca2+-binding RTX toxin-like protein
MGRRLATVIMLGAMLLAFGGGVALAKVISCDSGRCVGTDKNDEITGSEKNDRIIAKKGSDIVDAEQGGKDRVSGGNGSDQINVRDGVPGAPDSVDCGKGSDTVFADPDDTFGANCEIEDVDPF